MIEDFAQAYREGMKEALDEISDKDLEAVVSVLLDAHEKGKKVFLIGNGGNAATASHFANDPNQRPPFRGRNSSGRLRSPTIFPC